MKVLQETAVALGAVCLVLFLIGLCACVFGVVYDSIVPVEKRRLFKALDERGHIVWGLDEENNKTWKVSCPSCAEKE